MNLKKQALQNVLLCSLTHFPLQPLKEQTLLWMDYAVCKVSCSLSQVNKLRPTHYVGITPPPSCILTAAPLYCLTDKMR